MASMPSTMSRAPHQGSTKVPAAGDSTKEAWTPTHMVMTMLGPRDRMPANRMMEMPLPMPNSVICSPSHMTKAEPAVKLSTMTIPAQMLFMPPRSSSLLALIRV